LQESRVCQEPSLKGLDNLAVALVGATTCAHRQSHDEGVFEYIERIRLRLVLILWTDVRNPLAA
jgi:hypothetical protein